MTLALFAGALVGAGLWVIWSGWRPAPEPLGAALARLEGRRDEQAAMSASSKPGEASSDSRDLRVGAWLLQKLPPLARQVGRMKADLRLVGISPEEQAVKAGAQAAVGFFLGPWLGLLAALVGISPPPVLLMVVSVLGGVWGAVAPFAKARRRAAERRVAFSYALSAWCDVVVMSLAAGRGVEQAMETGASAGQGWAFAELRGALGAAYVRGDAPWEALATLGREIKVKDLEELAATISMAGEEGAAVRETLSVKSRTIRERRTAEAEQESASATEKMGLPAVLVVFGFVIFLGFPMAMRMFQGFG